MDTLLLQQNITRLARDETLRVHDAGGLHLGVVDGDVWVTQEGDNNDYVLASGASFRFDRNGLALVTALRCPASVLLEEGIVARAPSARRWPAPDENVALRYRSTFAMRDSVNYEQRIRSIRSEAISRWLSGLATRLTSTILRAIAAMPRGARATPSRQRSATLTRAFPQGHRHTS